MTPTSSAISLGRMILYVGVDSRGMTTGLTEVQRKVATVGQDLRFLGMQLTSTVTAPLVAVGAVAVKSFASFDAAITKSISIMGKAGDILRPQLEDTAKQISARSITPLRDLGAAYYYLASSGMDAKQSLMSLATVEKFAVAGAFGLEKATSLLTDSLAALKLKTADYNQNLRNLQRLSDALVRADIVANASTEQFARALTNKAGAAIKMVNKDLEEGIAILAAFAAQGLKGAAAGMALYTFLREIQRSSIRKANIWSMYGINAFDQTGTLLKVSTILRQIEKATDNLTDAQKRWMFMQMGFQDKALGVLYQLIGMSDKIDEYEKALRSAAGTTEEVANRQLRSFTNQMKNLWNQIVLVGVEIGQRLVPYIEKLSNLIKRGLQWWWGLSDATKDLVVKWGLFVFGLGPVLLITSKIILSFTGLAAMMNTVISLVSGLVGGFAKVGRVFSGPFSLFIKPLNFLLKGIQSLSWGMVPLLGTISALVPALAPLLFMIGAAAPLIGGIFGKLTLITGILPGFVKLAATIAFFLSLWKTAAPLLKGGVDALKSMSFQDMWNYALSAASQYFYYVIGFLAHFRENMVILWTWFQANWRNVLTDAGNVFVVFLSNLWTNFKTILSPFFGYIGQLFSLVVSVSFKSINDMLYKYIISAGAFLTAFFSSIASTIWTTLSSVFVNVLMYLQHMIGEMYSLFDGFLNMMQKLPGRIMSAIGSKLNPFGGVGSKEYRKQLLAWMSTEGNKPFSYVPPHKTLGSAMVGDFSAGYSRTGRPYPPYTTPQTPSFQDTLKQALDAQKGWLNLAPDSIAKEWTSGLKEGFKDVSKNLWTGLKEGFDGMRRPLEGFQSSIKELPKVNTDMTKALVNALNPEKSVWMGSTSSTLSGGLNDVGYNPLVDVYLDPNNNPITGQWQPRYAQPGTNLMYEMGGPATMPFVYRTSLSEAMQLMEQQASLSADLSNMEGESAYEAYETADTSVYAPGVESRLDTLISTVKESPWNAVAS